MRGCVTAVLLFLSSATAFPQCNYTSVASAQFRSSYLDLAVDGNDLWSATSYGVQLHDRSVDPPALVASIPLPGLTRAIVTGGGATYAGSGRRIYTLRKSGRSITVAGSIDAGGTVNDLEYASPYLYAATSNGLQQYDLANPAAPQQIFTLPTSSANVLSLSLAGSLLYAADGDNTVEQFNLAAQAQQTGSFETLPRATAVHATATRLFVSDGQNTEAFIVNGSTVSKAGTTAMGSTSFALLTSDVAFMAGSGRRFRAVDWTTVGSPVELFATDISPNGGTVNRIGAMQVAAGRLYVAAGDAGLLSYDTSTFASPFPVRSYASGQATSVIWAGGDLYASRAEGGISDYLKSSAGNLTIRRQWDSPRVQTLQDSTTGTLLSSAGSSLLYWSLGSTTPVLVSNERTFPASIASAVIVGSNAVAVLDDEDHTVWTVDMSAQTAPQPLKTRWTALSVARSGNAVVLADVNADAGTTTISYFADGDLNAEPKRVTVPGGATARVAFSGTTAAVFTFRGISLVDVVAQSATEVPGSNVAIARGLAFSGSRLLEVTEDALLVWDVATRTLVRSLPLPRDAGGIAADQLAAMPTDAGVMTAAFNAASTVPLAIASPNANSYYKRAVAAGDRLYLFDGRSIDVFATTFGYGPHRVQSVTDPGIVDIAASTSGLYAVTQLSTATSLVRYSRDGFPVASAVLPESTDLTPLALFSAGNAVWLSVSRGCLSGGCEKKTLVFDATTLAQTTTLDGAAVDVTTSGKRAYAIFDLPSEVRIYSIDDAARPALITARATEGTRPPVSISASGGSVYVLGEKLFVYSDDTLSKTGEQLGAYQSDPSSPSSFAEQRVSAEQSCVAVAGHSGSLQFFTLPSWSASQIEPPSTVRSMAAANGRLYVLTDHSLEIYASGPATPPTRRRAAR